MSQSNKIGVSFSASKGHLAGTPISVLMIKLMQKKVYELYKKFLVTITFPHYLTVFIKYRYE